MVFLKNNPFIKLVLPLIFGILIQYFIKIPFSIIVSLLLLSFLFWAITAILKLSYKLQYLYGIALNFFLFSASTFLVHHSKAENNANTNMNNTVVLAGEINKPLEKQEKFYKTEITVTAFKQGASWTDFNTTIIAYFNDDFADTLKAGNKVMLNTKLNNFKKRLNPFGFDYAKYMEIKNITNTVYLNKGDWILLSDSKGNIKTRALNIREQIIGLYERNGIADDNLAVLCALTLGYKNKLDEKVRKAYCGAGAMHVLAVSGLHVAILYAILSVILLFIPFKKLRVFIIIIALWAYAFITGLSPSVMRATIMFSFIIGGQLIGKKINIYNSLAASAFLLLIINPLLIFEVGFQLSYIAVIGIVFFHPKIYCLFYFPNKLLQKLWSLTAVSIAAQLVTFPLTIYHFNQFPTYFWISNIGVTFAAMILIILAFLLSISFSWVFISKIIALLINGALNINSHFIQWINELPGAIIPNISFISSQVYLLYAILICISFYIMTKKYRAITMSMFLILCSGTIRLYQNISIKNQQAVCVYHTKAETAIQFISSNNSIWLTSSKKEKSRINQLVTSGNICWGSEQNSLFLLENVDSSIMNKSFWYYNKGYWAMQNSQGLIINTQTYLPQSPKDSIKLNYLFVTGSPSFSLNDLSDKITYNKVIIDGSVPYWKARAFVPEGSNSNVYYTKNNGAFINSENF
jgi:competence protein ComEC